MRGMGAVGTAPVMELFVSPSETTANEKFADSFVLAGI
jgi:hypothetical protein